MVMWVSPWEGEGWGGKVKVAVVGGGRWKVCWWVVFVRGGGMLWVAWTGVGKRGEGKAPDGREEDDSGLLNFGFVLDLYTVRFLDTQLVLTVFDY